MPEDNIKNITDLLAAGRTKKAPTPQASGPAPVAASAPVISSDETEDVRLKKMHDIRLHETELSVKKKADELGLPYLNLVGFPISEEAVISIPKDEAIKQNTVCFFNDGKQVRIATTQPGEKVKALLDGIIKEKMFGNGTGEIYLISENSLAVGIKNYDRIPELKEVKYGIEITKEQLDMMRSQVTDFGRLNAMINEEKNMTNVFALMVAGAMESGASDIHIETGEKEIILRFRLDGLLQQAAALKKELWDRLDSRIKTIAGLKINVTDVPQDGRITIYLGKDDKLDLRVSTLPTAFGESIVMRLLTSKAVALTFDDLGLRGKSYDDLLKATDKTTGMIITTGPTGSGKTTTLYAILRKLNDGESKLLTLEDPIEYRIQGVSQSQIDHSKGFSFASGLRSLMRQDPDVIMVGEMRDLETAEVGIEAALTGHKVLSTIHTNDAAGAVPRFLSMGVKPFLLAPALNGVIGQRLVRRVHDACKVKATPEPALIATAQKYIDNLPENSGYAKVDLSKHEWVRGQGCEICKHVGYKGRVGIYEIFAMNEEFEKMILKGDVSTYDMAATANKSGMITMIQDGILKAMDGMTTLDEVFRVAG